MEYIKSWCLLPQRQLSRWILVSNSITPEVLLRVTEMQGEAEHPRYLGDEPMAGGEAEGDGGLGRGREARDGFVALRGPCRRRDDERSGSLQVRNAGEARRRSWFRLGVLRVQVAHPLLREVWSVLV